MADAPSWTFLTNHGHVMICIVRDPDARLRDIAEEVGITDRAVQTIIGDLVDAGYLDKRRRGRRNHYLVNTELPLRHPLEAGYRVGELLDVIGEPAPDGRG